MACRPLNCCRISASIWSCDFRKRSSVVDDRRPIGREIGRAVIGQDGDAVLRQQPIADEPDGRVDPLVGPLEAPPAEDEEEDALILGRQGSARAPAPSAAAGRPGLGSLRRQRMGVKQPDFLRDSVLLDR